ncbi:disease resistance protein RUN1 isoform X2 [Gossypium hirsutum]|uniref:Disease resistance protein RUN1 isoform X2 n=1 Tax=Gossypium hirsutum TaxID=3635 RepID=A0ABM3AXT0_GOSHI|nr:disease resistance protein RUN1 isoform X2 [Gossypium hirsutum]
MASSSSSSRQMKHQVFLSFRGEDTRLNFTVHLLQALKDKGLNVFFDEEKLEKGEELSHALSQAIAASDLSILVLSKDYASSQSCLAELSDIMDRKRKPTDKHIVLPIFYHVDPSDVRNIGGTFKTSFEEHESKRPIEDMKRWKVAFAEIGASKGWHIEGGKSDRFETEYIKDVVEYVLKKLNSNCRSVSEELVGIDDQKKKLLVLIEQAGIHVIGLWGMSGIGKTTLADAVYKEVSPKFECSLFLQNISEKIKKQGSESLRNELLSKLLNNTLSIGYPYHERLNNKKILLVFDDVTDPDQMDFVGVKYFGPGSKIIVTSRDIQVLRNGGANHIHEFVEYAQGNPLALKVLGLKLYTKSIKEWKSEVTKLKQCGEIKLSHILKSSLDGLDEIEKNIFLDVACIFKGQHLNYVEKILNNYYKGARCGISKLVGKCLLEVKYESISMHGMLEEMGKDIVMQESEYPGKRSRLWNCKDVEEVISYDKGTDLIKGIKVDMTEVDSLQFCATAFEKMHKLRYINISFPKKMLWLKKLYANQVESISLPDELRFLRWDVYPFKSLSGFNPKNLVVLKLLHGNMEQLWNEDDDMNLTNLREIDVSYCKNLRKMHNLSGAINLELLRCIGCESLVELWSEDDHIELVNLREIYVSECKNIRKICNLSRAINLEFLDCSYSKSLVELWNEDDRMDLVHLRKIYFDGCVNLRKIPNLSRAINLEFLGCSNCKSLVELPCLNHLASLHQYSLRLNGCYSLKKFPKVPRPFCSLDLPETKVEEVSDSIKDLHKLETLWLGKSKVKKVSINILKLEFLRKLDLSGCPIEEVSLPFDPLCNLQHLKMSGSAVKNVSIKLESLRKLNLSGCPMVKFPEIQEA